MSAKNGRWSAVEGVNTFRIFDVTVAPDVVGAVPVLGKVVNVGGAVISVSET